MTISGKIRKLYCFFSLLTDLGKDIEGKEGKKELDQNLREQRHKQPDPIVICDYVFLYI